MTVGFWSAHRLPGRSVPAYIGAQFLGAILASAALRLLFPAEADLGATRPGGGITASFVLETVLTFFLMFVILSVATGAKEKGIIAGIAVGSVVCFSAIFGGPISGASLNPARSLGPALFSEALGELWLYLLAPVLGALLAVGAWWGLGSGSRSG